jgi:hypothetical protein
MDDYVITQTRNVADLIAGSVDSTDDGERAVWSAQRQSSGSAMPSRSPPVLTTRTYVAARSETVLTSRIDREGVGRIQAAVQAGLSPAHPAVRASVQH